MINIKFFSKETGEIFKIYDVKGSSLIYYESEKTGEKYVTTIDKFEKRIDEGKYVFVE